MKLGLSIACNVVLVVCLFSALRTKRVEAVRAAPDVRLSGKDPLVSWPFVTVYFHGLEFRGEEGAQRCWKRVALVDGLVSADVIAACGGFSFQRHAILIRRGQGFPIDFTSSTYETVEPGDIIMLH